VGWVIQLAFHSGSAANPVLGSVAATPNTTKTTAEIPRFILHPPRRQTRDTMLQRALAFPQPI
jgi:hypothetical protein